jgi:hypothetical protein
MKHELTIAFHWVTSARSSNKLSMEPIGQKTGSTSKILTTMVGDKGGYDYKLTITFHWATNARSNDNERIGPIEAKNGAGCKGL